MTKPSSQLYRCTLPEVEKRLISAIAKGCRQSTTAPVVFFRADDIGIPSSTFNQLISCFRKHQMPLCLATVPAWLTATRLSALQDQTGDSNGQWYWHQHGYVHRNYELEGKKQEFGPARNYSDIRSRLEKGKHRLDLLLDKRNQPVFTPPWNRCSQETLQSLQDLNFKAISRSHGAKPHPQEPFPDFQVNVDLHTRKENSPEIGFQNLLTEIEQGLAHGQCGIMLHHQRMNRRAVALLDTLLQCFKKQTQISFVHFGDLLS